MAGGPVLGRLTATYPLRRSNLVLGVVAATVVVWTAVLLWPGAAPLPLVVVLVLVLSVNGPASLVGFDFARTFNPATRLGSATGIVNVGGFIASLLAILGVGLLLDLRAPGGDYDLADYKVAFSVQYLLWGVGALGIWRTRVLARRRLREAGTRIDPLARAIARHWGAGADARAARGPDPPQPWRAPQERLRDRHRRASSADAVLDEHRERDVPLEADRPGMGRRRVS